MREEYISAEMLTKDLTIAMVWHLHYESQLWVLVRVRDGHTCEITGQPIPMGSFAFRPMSNGYNRMERVSVDGMRRLCGAEARGE